MTELTRKIIIAFECHDVETIKECFRQGINPNAQHKGQPIVQLLHDGPAAAGAPQ